MIAAVDSFESCNSFSGSFSGGFFASLVAKKGFEMSVLDQIEKANEQPFCRELLSRVSQDGIARSALHQIQLLMCGIKASGKMF